MEVVSFMKRHILLIVVLALVSRLAISQLAIRQEQSAGCKPGNLFSESSPRTIDEMERFLTELHTAVASGDKLRVAQLAHYPLSVATANSTFTVYSDQQFVTKYDEIFPVQVRVFLLKQEPQCVSHVGARGYSIGTGQIWFDKYPNGAIKIFSVNAIVYPGE